MRTLFWYATVTFIYVVYDILFGTAPAWIDGFSELCLFVILMPPTIARFHDIDLKGSHIFLLFVPIAGLYYFLKLLFSVGTDGLNRFGPEPVTKKILSDTNVLDNSIFQAEN